MPEYALEGGGKEPRRIFGRVDANYASRRRLDEQSIIYGFHKRRQHRVPLGRGRDGWERHGHGDGVLREALTGISDAHGRRSDFENHRRALNVCQLPPKRPAPRAAA